MRCELTQTLRNSRKQAKGEDRQQLDRELQVLPTLSAEAVVARYVESLLRTSGDEIPLRFADEWQTHLKAVFEGHERLGGQKGGKEKRVTLRYLDKGRDLAEYLRFADATQCCFTSQNPEHNKHWLSRIWKDPLSFVFLIEENEPGAEKRSAIGFVFGSFGVKDRKPAVLLNGVYMQGKTNAAVLSILNAIEEDFSKPIGAAHQFVAATYGGHTQIDSAELHAAGGSEIYTNEPTEVVRLRALAEFNGQPETDIYDDLGVGINRRTTTGGHVWHKIIK